uniref:Membrane-bound lytic murein transglycosylase D n=1 Tax=Candidatus Kentrum eta TaxID=2126337 RepID=A0A450UKD2_9GAMM|nr:MAG: membrane-bound lytic murein transglycosylase D [Candidatus Kentron sp. H]VFJ92967.1 MAG: membrane-bound lytic murein transglycosylase D [Candidatus Kentron sp. H]VFJ99577.1 MAG: membrane-bound lytic murein transglycosylase D [Candidatus Kentron sp. H]
MPIKRPSEAVKKSPERGWQGAGGKKLWRVANCMTRFRTFRNAAGRDSGVAVAGGGFFHSLFTIHPLGFLLFLTLLGGLWSCSSLPGKPDPTAHDDLWDRIRASFQLQEAYGAREARSRLNWFKNNQSYFHRLAERGSRYLYHIIEEVERRGMPGEIALLPAVESAFRPFAYSPAHASGIWQFIPATGKRYGLKQTWWYDGRRDIPASTRAALTYLQALNARFDGDWLLAIAAYNTGEGNVERAIRRNRKAGRGTDFRSLDLPAETRNYVPQLLALASIVQDPDRYGLTLKKIPNRPYFQKVPIHSPIELSLAAKTAGLPLEEMRRLNPAFRRWATGPDGPHHLLVPIDRAAAFRKALHGIPVKQRVRWHRHVVKKGESLNTIAAWFKTRPPVLRQLNRLRGNTIAVGQVLLIPTVARANYQPDTSVRKTRPKSRKGRSKRPRVHVVRPGENLSLIARRYRVSLAQLVLWNGIARNSVLIPGQRLKLSR